MRADAKKNYDQLLEVGCDLVAEQGTDASMRDVARRAGVGIGTVYRHFPTRDAFRAALLGKSVDALTAKAEELQAAELAGDALVAWLRELVVIACKHPGVIVSMTAAFTDPDSALHSAGVKLRASGTQLLTRAQRRGDARVDIDGADLFALVSAIAWLNDQAAFASRSDHLFGVIASAILSHASSHVADGGPQRS
jgi:AcrR family transcriptional regulator